MNVKQILFTAMLANGEPLSIERMQILFTDDNQPKTEDIKNALEELSEECKAQGLLLKEVASGYMLQIAPEHHSYITRLFEKRPQRYSRALLETLALVAYRQPITRAEIEDVRGVAVSSHIFKILMEREWVRVIGHKDVPGKPALYATTKQFLDYFNLKSLKDLPSLINFTLPEEISNNILVENNVEEIMESEILVQEGHVIEEECALEEELAVEEEALA